MSNAKFFVPMLIVTAFLLYGARSIQNTNNHPNISQCVGECYEQYKIDDMKRRKAEAAMMAVASPVDLGKKSYMACMGCHGMNGEGGIGPMIKGQSKDSIVGMLVQYKNGETRGAQSALMWGQAAGLSTGDMTNLAAYIETL